MVTFFCASLHCYRVFWNDRSGDTCDCYEYRPWPEENENLMFLQSTETLARFYNTQESHKCAHYSGFSYPTIHWIAVIAFRNLYFFVFVFIRHFSSNQCCVKLDYWYNCLSKEQNSI